MGGEVGIPLELKQGMGPHLRMRWETRGSSRLVAGNSSFISSCDGDLELHEGSQASSRVLRGNSGMLSRCCRRKGPRLALTGASCGLSRVAVGGLGFLSRYHRELGEPLVLSQQSQVSIRVVRASAGVLWSHGRGIRPHFRSLPLLNSLCMWLVSHVQFFVTS